MIGLDQDDAVTSHAAAVDTVEFRTRLEAVGNTPYTISEPEFRSSLAVTVHTQANPSEHFHVQQEPGEARLCMGEIFMGAKYSGRAGLWPVPKLDAQRARELWFLSYSSRDVHMQNERGGLNAEHSQTQVCHLPVVPEI